MTTQYYHHDFDNVEDYLHHRSPWLMVDSIDGIASTSIDTQKSITGHEPFFPAHFPGAPVVPGSMLQEMATQSAGILLAARFNPMSEFNTHDPQANEFALGVLVRMKDSRFRGFVRPGDALQIHVDLHAQIDHVFEFLGKVRQGDQTVLTTRFQLANIRTSLLVPENPESLETVSA